MPIKEKNLESEIETLYGASVTQQDISAIKEKNLESEIETQGGGFHALPD